MNGLKSSNEGTVFHGEIREWHLKIQHDWAADRPLSNFSVSGMKWALTR